MALDAGCGPRVMCVSLGSSPPPSGVSDLAGGVAEGGERMSLAVRFSSSGVQDADSVISEPTSEEEDITGTGYCFVSSMV